MIRKSIVVSTFLVLCSCSEKAIDLNSLISKDSIQYWNYEWKRNYPNKFGKTYSFNKNGDLLQYFYMKKSGHREIYTDDFHKPKKWSLSADSSLRMNNDIFKVINFSEDTLMLVNSKFQDTSLLLRTKKKFDILLKKKPDNFFIHQVTKDTIWINSY